MLTAPKAEDRVTPTGDVPPSMWEPARRSVLEVQIDSYLAGVNASTWGGQGWDLTDTEERAEAVAWLHKTIMGVIDTELPKAY